MNMLIRANKMSVSVIVYTMLLVGFKSAFASQFAVKDLGPAPGFGYVCCASLAAFAPVSASLPLHQIRTLQFAAAYGPLQTQYAKYPNSLAVIAGLLQASIGEPSPNFLDETLQKLGSQREQQLSVPDRFRIATALYYRWSCGWPHPDENLLRRSQRILSELWQTDHDPVEGLMLAETGLSGGPMSDPGIHINVMGIHEQIICSLITPAGAKQFTTASQDGWQGDPPSLNDVPLDDRERLMCVVQSLYWLNNFRIGKMQKGTMVFTLPPDEKAVLSYLKPWLIALGAATGLKPAFFGT